MSRRMPPLGSKQKVRSELAPTLIALTTGQQVHILPAHLACCVPTSETCIFVECRKQLLLLACQGGTCINDNLHAAA